MSDTVKVMSEYADVTVIRHPDGTIYEQLDGVSPSTPIINAGNGALEHPTQALLVLLCIQTELKQIDGLSITLVGDLKHGRTVHSLGTLLSNFDGITLNLVAPDELRMPTEWMDHFRAANPKMTINELENYKDVVGSTDVLYMTRIQQERFATAEAYEKVKGHFVLKPADLTNSNAMVMHPLPRVNEIDVGVDALPNARYFEQTGYGVVMRMALLGLATGAKGL